MAKHYGNLVMKIDWNKSGSDAGIMDRTILVYETKTLFKVQLWNSGFNGWMGSNHKPIKETKYKKNDYSDLNTIPEIIEAKKKYVVYA